MVSVLLIFPLPSKSEAITSDIAVIQKGKLALDIRFVGSAGDETSQTERGNFLPPVSSIVSIEDTCPILYPLSGLCEGLFQNYIFG